MTYGAWGNPMGLIGALGGPYRVREDPKGSTGLWEDLWVTYEVWENPKRSNAALEDPMGVLGGLGESYGCSMGSVKTLWGLGESYGSHWGSGRTLWGSTGLWEDPMGVLWGLGGPLGDLWGLGEP